MSSSAATVTFSLTPVKSFLMFNHSADITKVRVQDVFSDQRLGFIGLLDGSIKKLTFVGSPEKFTIESINKVCEALFTFSEAKARDTKMQNQLNGLYDKMIEKCAEEALETLRKAAEGLTRLQESTGISIEIVPKGP